ncbi:hypothetical protein UlMin_007059 [Ulmus minor]
MVEPLPPLNKVFSLVVQEECQRSINYNSSASPAFLAPVSSRYPVTSSTPRPRKDRPLCTHCNVLGHTVERCYKIHGYPPGYKSKPNFRPNTAQTHQMSFNQNTAPSTVAESSTSSTHSNLTSTQCQHIIALLSSHVSLGEPQPPEPSISNFSGPFTWENDWDR